MLNQFVMGSLLGGATAILCVVMHHEFLYWWASRINRHSSHGRLVILWLVLSLIIMHSLEITVFALAYYLVVNSGLPGSLVGDIQGFGDYIYYSAAVYTTVGYGDITPLGILRPLSTYEALTGLVMITWSASFTFPEMQRFWKGY